MIGMLNIRQYMDFYFRIAYRSVLYRSSAHQGTNQVCMTWTIMTVHICQVSVVMQIELIEI